MLFQFCEMFRNKKRIWNGIYLLCQDVTMNSIFTIWWKVTSKFNVETVFNMWLVFIRFTHWSFAVNLRGMNLNCIDVYAVLE